MLDQLTIYFYESPNAYITFVFLISLLIGSFLNVVIYRVPIMMKHEWGRDAAEYFEDTEEMAKLEKMETFNLVKPDSTCPKCSHKILAWENIPVISWIYLKGKCSGCKASISARYPIIEVSVALLSAIVAWKYGFTAQGLFLICLSWALFALAVIDYDTLLLPDTITLPLVWIGLVLNWQGFIVDLPDALFGAVAAYVSLFSITWIHSAITGRVGMGNGDFKLFAAFGAWFGWLALLPIIIFSCAFVIIYAVYSMAILSRTSQDPMPFGPSMCAACMTYIVFGNNFHMLYY